MSITNGPKETQGSEETKGLKTPFPPMPHSHPGAPSFPFSKILMAFVFIGVIGFSVFYAGIYMNLNKEVTKATQVGQQQPTVIPKTSSPTEIVKVSVTPSCKPRPACLDATPRCLIPETFDMCPSKTLPSTAAGQMCTMDAKRCPDGKYVSRTGPNCTFAACPVK